MKAGIFFFVVSRHLSEQYPVRWIKRFFFHFFLVAHRYIWSILLKDRPLSHHLFSHTWDRVSLWSRTWGSLLGLQTGEPCQCVHVWVAIYYYTHHTRMVVDLSSLLSWRALLFSIYCFDSIHYQCGYLWHYGVTQTLQAVHPIGYPISHSTQFGFS
jgi:hypothetical protein